MSFLSGDDPEGVKSNSSPRCSHDRSATLAKDIAILQGMDKVYGSGGEPRVDRQRHGQIELLTQQL